MADAVVADFAEAREGAFGGGGLYVGKFGEGLEENGGAHGEAQAVEAVAAFGALVEVLEPAAHVVALKGAVGDAVAAAFAVASGVDA